MEQPTIAELADAVVGRLGYAKQPLGCLGFIGGVCYTPPRPVKTTKQENYPKVVQYPGMLHIYQRDYGVVLYRLPDGWLFGFKDSDPNDDLMETLLSSEPWNHPDLIDAYESCEAQWRRNQMYHAPRKGSTEKRKVYASQVDAAASKPKGKAKPEQKKGGGRGRKRYAQGTLIES